MSVEEGASTEPPPSPSSASGRMRAARSPREQRGRQHQPAADGAEPVSAGPLSSRSAPADLGHRIIRMAERLVLGDEEPLANHAPITTRLKTAKAAMASGGVDGDRADVAQRRGSGSPRRQRTQHGGRQRGDCDRPRLVARQARERERRPDECARGTGSDRRPRPLRRSADCASSATTWLQ